MATVYTCFCTDVIHEGHMNIIREAKKYGDVIVGVISDKAMIRFIESYRNGCDVVYGVRNDRNTDGFFKKFTASLYYKMMHLMGCKVLANSADYRLLSKRACEA